VDANGEEGTQALGGAVGARRSLTARGILDSTERSYTLNSVS